DIQHGSCSRAGQVVASECGSQLAVKSFNIRMNDGTGYGESVAHSFSYGNDISLYASVLMGKEAAGAAIARLYLIYNKEGSCLRAKLPYLLKIINLRYMDAADALNTFNNDRTGFIISQFLTQRFGIIEFQEGRFAALIYWGRILFIIGDTDSS